MLSEKIQTITHLNPYWTPDNNCDHEWIRCWAPLSGNGLSHMHGRWYECKKCHGTTTESDVPVRQRRHLITHGPDTGRTIKYSNLEEYRMGNKGGNI